MYTISYPSGKITSASGTEVLPGPDMDAYVAWLKEGNGPTVTQDPPTIPRITVSAWQIRKALNETGQRTAVENAVAASPDVNVQDGWNYATEFESDNALILAMQSALGMTAEEMYAVFRLAETL